MMKKLSIFAFVLTLTMVAACSSDEKPTTQSSTTQSTSLNSSSAYERDLYQILPSDQQNCRADRSPDDQKMWPIAIAILSCDTPDVSNLAYGLFSTEKDLDDTYEAQAKALVQNVADAGGSVKETPTGTAPCSTHPNESGEWGINDGTGDGGRYTCLSEPYPRIVWTAGIKKVIGDASLENGNIEDLVTWWTQKAGPK
jgi:outer membrane murein-binding lipoprotein Lpp